MNSYVVTKRSVTIAIIGYLVLALQPWKPNGVELFPFFNWSLFSHSVENRSDALILVHELDGQELDPPLPIHELAEHFPSAAGSVDLFKVSRDLIYAVSAGEDTDIDAIRSVLESRFMPEESHVRYQLAIGRYSPLERYQGDGFKAIDPVRMFEKRRETGRVQHR